MSADTKPRDEGFLSRWSRRKVEAREVPPDALPETQTAAPVDDEPPVLPRIDELTLDSDFRGFFHPKVDEDLRRAALRKLFGDPHFNVMDGLDTYIDDYSKTEPIPPAMLAGLRQAQRILNWAEGKDDTPEVLAEEADAAVAAECAPDPSLPEPAASIDYPSGVQAPDAAEETHDHTQQASPL